MWFTEAAIAAWKAEPRATRGGQPRYSALAITTALTLRAVFSLALRQTEGLVGSLLRVEADIGRYKRVIGDALRSRTGGRQTTEVAIAAASLNRMLELGRPEYVRLT